ncbi:Ppx/GppA phosphatase family protein [Helicobacter sp. MIT 21-1697]|uniref:Ppx/GppA phosphatase family protein n=1 Tax=Helicobacter sp. MIT 21-1697 TaxID=2993733 RepID=UPI00224B45A9|nr:Ppx/GppA phosphatase family protein [Helicobacter sp. MIT 21-1697]MCX2717772.1 Ppx/GppA phosphatase family protein [Helicobacter sp. MIT 21-1697]
MAKITTVIDIGSNSARMAIYRRTSRFAFHLIYETKSKVRISEGCYESGGVLGQIPMDRAIYALKEFVQIAKAHKSRKIFCVATSALRDAPNAKVLLDRAKKECGVSIKVIDGKKEALYGGIACANLSHYKDGITMDIGGGSTECALIQDGKIIDLISLDIGTIRLKELFFDKKNNIEGARAFIQAQLANVPSHFRHHRVFGVGGTIRALSKMIMKYKRYPIQEVHGYEVNVEQNIKFFEKISQASEDKLDSMGVPQDRIDNIRSGSLILQMFLTFFGAKEIVTSGVGVREGVFLSDLLRGHKNSFPKGINPSINCIEDRFMLDKKYAEMTRRESLKIFDALFPLHKLDEQCKKLLHIASYLSSIGRILNFYNAEYHGSYFLLNALEYGFSHTERMSICLLVEYSGKKIPQDESIRHISDMMPKLLSLQWLSFMLALAENLCRSEGNMQIRYEYVKPKTLRIYTIADLYLAKENINKLHKPEPLQIEFIKV